MESWTVPEPPPLPGNGSPLQVWDTSRRALVSVPRKGIETVHMYVCGITPYDATHVGHCGTYFAFDIAQRMWRDAGKEIHYVQNVTDIDISILDRARRNNEDWQALATTYTKQYCDDMTALNVLPPSHLVTVTEAIDDIIQLAETLLSKRVAYQVENGNLYFDVHAAKHFGYISSTSRETMIELTRARETGHEKHEGRRDPLDPILWRAARPGQPSWPAPFGAGQPGWHIECAQIAAGVLGTQLDVHGGGADLGFPHHELSAAHAEAAYEVHPFAHAYVHPGMVTYDGQKMAKSKGNLVFISQLHESGVDPSAIRLALLSTHYRTERAWSDSLLRNAHDRLARWQEATSRPSGPNATSVLTDVRTHLANDLDTPAALSIIDSWADATLTETGDDPHAPQLVSQLADSLLGVRLYPRM